MSDTEDMSEKCGYAWRDNISHECAREAGHDADPRTDRHECECGAWDYRPAGVSRA
jgi:hypothetical protein